MRICNSFCLLECALALHLKSFLKDSQKFSGTAEVQFYKVCDTIQHIHAQA